MFDFIRTIIFWVLMILITVVLTVCGLLSVLIPSYRFRYFVITRWSLVFIFLSHYVLKINYKIKGIENLHHKHPMIVVSNHQSAWEAIFFQTIFPAQTWVLKKELLFIPVFGWGLALLNPIAINRKAKSNALSQVIFAGKKRLKQRIWVVIFPEGARVEPGKSAKKWGKSFAQLSFETKSPILPVAHNAGKCWKKRGFVKPPGTIEIEIGPIISGEKSAQALFEETKTWIEIHSSSLNSSH
ncbi:MAG: 1-acyl-sn-glycerol-3-phosphate acyltransferase [Legionellales bacterium]|nr:1-acyl-sn-glycerol-3-phosphate acyltransferase [Legionellales bacterium]